MGFFHVVLHFLWKNVATITVSLGEENIPAKFSLFSFPNIFDDFLEKTLNVAG
jgi:hypothetical protein